MRDGIKLLPLLTDDLCNLLEQHVQIAHALLDIPNLLFSLDDKRVLEVDLVLRGQTGQLLLLLLLEELGGLGGGRLGIDGGPGGGDGCLLLFEGLALEVLEVGEGGLEFAGEFLLGVFLGGLWYALAKSVPEGIRGQSYSNVLPRLDLLHALADILEYAPRFL
jgi:hypothetical protein